MTESTAHQPPHRRTAPRRTKQAPRADRKLSKSQPLAAPDAPVIDSGARHAMIAKAAYYLAERRGFDPGYELDDWLAAETDVERAISAQAGAAPSLCGDY